MLPNDNITRIGFKSKQTINDVKATDTNPERRKQKQNDASQKRKKDSVQVSSETKNRKDFNPKDEDNKCKPTSNYSEKRGKKIDIIVK
ncbi:MAG: hypothetical protein HN590_11410 [Calditrichaeota bacterium]|jgi:hypothetical protein|nr:hypothetical protein [Calditrichota bacterium]MBT7789230.1 hypothetical protein [Calditrichota bacterium]